MHVWVARARAEAEATAARLRARRHDPLVAPLTRVVGTEARVPGGEFDAVLLTSARAAGALKRAGFQHLKVFAVGARTADAALRAEATDVLSADADAAALAALVRARLAPGARLLHAAGADRKAEPAATLARAGYAVVPWIVYAAEPVPDLPGAVADALRGRSRPLDAALHYSRRSAALALSRAREAGCEATFAGLKHLCLSRDVAVPLVEAGIAAHFVPTRPVEDALLAGLDGAA